MIFLLFQMSSGIAVVACDSIVDQLTADTGDSVVAPVTDVNGDSVVSQ